MDFPLVNFTVIGVVHSCYKEKFGIPRQPGLVKNATAYIELLPPYNDLNAVDGLELVSHVWVQFLFNANKCLVWKPKVRPPRLGGNRSLGVFATRSPVRPNPLGLSVVKLHEIKVLKTGGKVAVELHIGDHDLLDGTPVLDIKPYVPYADSLPQAKNDFADMQPHKYEVGFSAAAVAVCASELAKSHQLYSLISDVLAQDPRPAYQKQDPSRVYGVRLHDWNVRWRMVDIKGVATMWVDSVELHD